MLRAFDVKTDDRGALRLTLSALVAAAVLAGATAGVVAFGKSTPPVEEDEEVDVTFDRQPEPPPPVAPPPPAPPPAVPPDMKVKKVSAPKKLASLEPPKKIEKVEHAEADAASDAVEVPDDGGAGTGPPPVQPTPPPPPPPPPAPPPKKKTVEPVNVAENDTPPLFADDNAPPGYPAEARARGVEGLVILKLGISDTGKVISIQVMKGDEPFLSAALAVAKRWKFSPARHPDGSPFAAFIIQKIPFRLTN